MNQSGSITMKAADPAEPSAPERAQRREPTERRRRQWLEESVHRFAVVGVWAVMLGAFIAIEPDKILQVSAFQSIFGSQQPLVFLSMAALCAGIVGEFDLSVASVMGLSATILSVLAVDHGISTGLAALIALGAAVGSGLVNAYVVVIVGVDGFIVTLGAATLLGGVALLISHNSTVFGLSAGLSKITLADVLGLPISFYYGIALALGFAYVLSFTPLGRHMTFVGASREVARLAGVRVDRIRFLSYVVSATVAGLGGILLAAGLGGFDPSSSNGYLLPAISAVFLGTAVIQPGRLNPLGSMIGVYFLASGIFGLQLMGLGGWIQDVFYGGALVVAVAVSSLVRRRRGRS